MKRQICIRKAMGDITGAIKLLNEYLKLCMADTEAWLELADLYLDQQMYDDMEGNMTHYSTLGTSKQPSATRRFYWPLRTTHT